MKKIILYNPSVSTLNMGDYVIFDSIKKYLDNIFEDAFYVNISPHLPISFRFFRNFKEIDFRFVCGTNLLSGDMLFGYRQWDVSLLKSKIVSPAILFGCGWRQYQKRSDLYSTILNRIILSKEYIHSVRDFYTQGKLEEMGIKNVINTGCPTMWCLTPEHCKCIPIHKMKNVVTTLTDYNKDFERDSNMINILCRNYETVYLWLQGFNDYNYFKQLKLKNDIKIIGPSLEKYDNLLMRGDIEYVGTRLHGAIRALQHGKRSLILAVDNRAFEKKKDFNINVIRREEIDQLESLINCEIVTDIKLNNVNINLFLNQFK